MLQTEYQVPRRPGTNLEIRLKLLQVTLDRCYNCASELRLSLRLGIHFNKSLINIFQLVWLFYDDPERSYDRLKMTSIFIKLGVIQVLTYPCKSNQLALVHSCNSARFLHFSAFIIFCILCNDLYCTQFCSCFKWVIDPSKKKHLYICNGIMIVAC